MSNVPPPPPPGAPPPSSGPPPPPPPAYGAMLTVGVSCRYAGWWRRVGATMLDALISVVFLVPAVIVFIVGPTERGTCTDCDGFESSCTVPTGATMGLGSSSTSPASSPTR